jgi:hypothetical protein
VSGLVRSSQFGAEAHQLHVRLDADRPLDPFQMPPGRFARQPEVPSIYALKESNSNQPRTHCARYEDKYQTLLPSFLLRAVQTLPVVALEQTITATITNEQTNMAAQESNPNELSTSTTSPANILTYHCLCTQLSLATTAPLEAMPKRQLDAAAIATCGDFASATRPSLTMQALSVDEKATILKLDDGFEKRYAVRCTRCGLAAGYQLDKSQFSGSESESGPRADVVYILPGGLLTTEEMREGRSMEAEIGKVEMIAT